jgi:hypothetical protein
MNKTFEKPELEIIYFEGDLATDDVIATSGDLQDSFWVEINHKISIFIKYSTHGLTSRVFLLRKVYNNIYNHLCLKGRHI